MFRRPRLPFPPRFVANNTAIEGVTRANQLKADGQPRKAAELLMQLAREMQVAGRPRQEANMHAQAAHAWLDAGVDENALEQATLALTMFAKLSMWERAGIFKTNFINHIQRTSSKIQTSGVEQQYQILARAAGFDPKAAAVALVNRGTLPASCPHCGAPLRSDTVDWIDATSAECSSCGGTVIASKPAAV
jgi:hypothetical protein